MDPIEQKLYDAKIKAEYEYVKYLESKKKAQFHEETKDHVYNTEHWYYKMIISKQLANNNQTEIASVTKADVDNDCKALYKKLSIICHPDKCHEEWATKMSSIINKAYEENDKIKLDELNTYFETHSTFADYDVIDYVKEINSMKSQYWYQWYYDNHIIKDLYVSPSDLEKIKLEEQNMIFMAKVKTLEYSENIDRIMINTSEETNMSIILKRVD